MNRTSEPSSRSTLVLASVVTGIAALITPWVADPLGTRTGWGLLAGQPGPVAAAVVGCLCAVASALIGWRHGPWRPQLVLAAVAAVGALIGYAGIVPAEGGGRHMACYLAVFSAGLALALAWLSRPSGAGDA